MAIQTVNLGATGTGAGGDAARTAFEKMNQNFTNDAHAASRMVQTSPTDTTAGAMMTVGAFGLGASPVITDANAAPLGLSAINLAAALNVPAGLVGAGFIETRDARSLTTRSVQELYSSVQERKFIRTYTGSAWAPWREIFHAGNILGTVSQLNGIPTGAMFEYGKNANGEYLRLLDGTQWCWNRAAASGANTVASGSLFSTPQALMSYPAAFASVPVGCVIGAVEGRIPGMLECYQSQCAGRVFSTSASGTTYSFGFFVVGRWY